MLQEVVCRRSESEEENPHQRTVFLSGRREGIPGVPTAARAPGPAFPPALVDLLPQSLPSDSCKHAPGPGPRKVQSVVQADRRPGDLPEEFERTFVFPLRMRISLPSMQQAEGGLKKLPRWVRTVRLWRDLAWRDSSMIRASCIHGARAHRYINYSGRIFGGAEARQFAEPMPRAKPSNVRGSRRRALLPSSVAPLLLVGVSAPAVPPITAPAPAPRPPPRIAPAAAPPPAPMPTFLALLRLPLLRLFLLERLRLLEWLRLLEVAAITGKAVSPSSPKHKTAAHSDLFIDRPSPDKSCTQSAKVQTNLQPLWLRHLQSSPWGWCMFLSVLLPNSFAPFCVHGHPKG